MALKVYLLTYNLLLVGGWLWILIGTLQGVVSGSTAASIYQRLSIWLQLAQSAAILEVNSNIDCCLVGLDANVSGDLLQIVHAVSGVVKSSPIVTGLQVLSRLNIVWGILYSVPSVSEVEKMVEGITVEIMLKDCCRSKDPLA